MIELLHTDCMEYMKGVPDKFFDLAIVDPPYGIGANKKRGDTGRNKHIRQRDYHVGDWDSGIPPKEYFEQLIRISVNQIIWGGNYFLDYLESTSCFIVWDKDNGENLYADCELAWCSFDSAVRKYRFKWHGYLQGNMKAKEQRIHPTQKPKQLYKWLLTNYAKPGNKIFDSHLGSGSIAIACHDMGFDLVGCEIDKDYYDAAVKRFDNHKKQLALF